MGAPSAVSDQLSAFGFRLSVFGRQLSAELLANSHKKSSHKKARKCTKTENEECNAFIHRESQAKPLFYCASLRTFLRLFVAHFPSLWSLCLCGEIPLPESPFERINT